MAFRSRGPWCRSWAPMRPRPPTRPVGIACRSRPASRGATGFSCQVDAPGFARVTTEVVMTGPALIADVALSPTFTEAVTVPGHDRPRGLPVVPGAVAGNG